MESDGVEQIICETINKLLVYMEEMEKNAPDESVKELANILRNAVAQNSHVIKEDVHANYKVGLYNRVQFMDKLVNETELLTIMVKCIKEYGIEDIKKICQETYEKDTESFVIKIYKNYIIKGTYKELFDLYRILTEVEATVNPIIADSPED